MISTFSGTIDSETNMNFIDIGLYIVWNQVNIYKSRNNQNWPHIHEWRGDKSVEIIPCKDGFTAEASPSGSQSFSLSLDIRLFVHGSTKSRSVPMGKPLMPQDSTIWYFILAFPFECLWTGHITWGRAQVSQSRHRCSSNSSGSSQNAMRILHNNHIHNIYFNIEK